VILIKDNMSPVLLLDASYRPIKEISWKKAMTLFFQEKIEIIKEYENMWIKSPKKSYKVPAVVRLVNFIFKYPFGVKLTRYNIFIRDMGQCQYCSKKLNKKRFTVDHVIPKSKGGESSWENLVACCHKCNSLKGDTLLGNSGLNLKNKPTQPRINPLSRTWEEIPPQWKDFLFF
jgi:5-methylcytosine-specific restriction endonuclease McrA